MYEKFIAYTQAHHLIPSQGATLLAISGGVDSIILLHLFLKARYPIAIAHAHFGLRSEEADKDANFVEQLAKEHNLPFHLKHFETKTYAKANDLSTQMAARKLRYHWFSTLLREKGYTRLATAHHHNDQIETFLHNITQGTSIAGLRGIQPHRDNIIRPILFATKAEIIAYAKQEKLAWCEDSSNSALCYNRNFLRHQVIPLLKKINPGLEKTFHRTLTKLSQVETLFQESLNYWKKSVWQQDPPYYRIQLAPFQNKSWSPIALHNWLAPFGFTFEQINTWWQSPPQIGRKHCSTTHWLLAERGAWVVGPHHYATLPSYPISTFPAHIALPTGHQCTFEAPTPFLGAIPRDTNSALLDYDKLSHPLTLRPWQAGDTFVPLGMKGRHKKLSDFFIDKKIPRYQKTHTYLLTSAGKVAWVVGHQISDLFKVTATSQNTILCKLTLPEKTEITG